MTDKIISYTSLIEGELYEYFKEYKEEYKVVFDSMEYSVKNGGKRVRPLLTLLFCDACEGDSKNALPLACAVEYIHTYSLIHDDLPCMDNDDFRRGKPSNHIVYGEAFALLAGDGLLTAAFEKISDGAIKGLYSPEIALKATKLLSDLAGSRGMIGGQVIDLANENNPDATIETLRLLDKLKTGALIKAACVLGCLCAKAGEREINAASEFAEKIGLAFQIKDDILDVTSSLEKLGKQIGSDKEKGKSTYVNLLGVEKCEKLVESLTDEALSCLDVFSEKSALKDYANYLAKRDY